MRVLIEEKAFNLLFMPCKYIVQFVMVGWTLFVVSFAEVNGIDESLAAYLPLMGAFGGFIIQGIVTVILHHRPHWGGILFAVNLASVATAFFLYPLSSNFIHLCICSAFACGGVFGGYPCIYSVLVTYVAEENFTSILSLQFFVTGVAVLSSGYLAGSLYDLTGSFNGGFFLMGGMSAIAVLLTITLMVVKKVQRNGREH